MSDHKGFGHCNESGSKHVLKMALVKTFQWLGVWACVKQYFQSASEVLIYFYFVEWTMDILAEKICKPKDIITVT